MAAPTLDQAIVEMKGVAGRLRAEAAVMRAATRRQGQRYIVGGLFIAAYMSWAFVRTAQFVDADRLATITGDLAIASASGLVDDASAEASLSPIEAVRYASTQMLNDVSEAGHGVTKLLESDLPAALDAYYEPSDRALMDSIAKLPDAEKLIAAAGASPAKSADALLSKLPAPAQSPSPALSFLRDHLQRLASRQTMSVSEQAQRRVLQAAFAKPADKGK